MAAVLPLSENNMNEWIIAPLLAADGTASHRPASNGSEAATDKQDEQVEQDGGGQPVEERRHGDRRDNHDEQVDTDFARGEDRREDVP
jgi:hypothetical protein